MCNSDAYMHIPVYGHHTFQKDIVLHPDLAE